MSSCPTVSAPKKFGNRKWSPRFLFRSGFVILRRAGFETNASNTPKI